MASTAQSWWKTFHRENTQLFCLSGKSRKHWRCCWGKWNWWINNLMSSSAESQAFSAPASYILYLHVHATEMHPDNCSFTPLAPPCVSCSMTADQDFILYCNHNHVEIYFDIYTNGHKRTVWHTLRRTARLKLAVSSTSWDSVGMGGWNDVFLRS